MGVSIPSFWLGFFPDVGCQVRAMMGEKCREIWKGNPCRTGLSLAVASPDVRVDLIKALIYH